MGLADRPSEPAPRSGARCHARLEGLPIADARSPENLGTLTAAEVEELAQRHIQSMAGVVAAKRALQSLLADLGETRADARTITVLHDPDGAPRLSRHPRLPLGLGPIHLSITHTRTHAYALVTSNSLQEKSKR